LYRHSSPKTPECVSLHRFAVRWQGSHIRSISRRGTLATFD